MILDPLLVQRLKSADIRDPGELTSAICGKLPADDQASYNYRPRDWLRVRAERDRYHVALSYNAIGRLRLNYVKDSHGTDVGIGSPGIPETCLTPVLQGRVGLVVPTRGAEVIGEGANGFVYRGSPGTRILSTDESARLNLWISDDLLRAALERLIDAPMHGEIVFDPLVTWDAGHTASIRRTVEHLVEDLSQPDPLMSDRHAGPAYEEWLTYAVLLGLRHSHTEQLQRRETTAVAIPGHLRRAEAFMHASADRPIMLADVAAAAACSVGTLRVAFRRFRDTTPLAALHDIRLQRARAALLIADRDEPTGAIARRFGFTNPSRFIAAYGRRFGEHPNETRRPSAWRSVF